MEQFQYNLKSNLSAMEEKDIPKINETTKKLAEQYRKANNIPDIQCCLCDELCETYGNNPAPLIMKRDARCCNTCNSYKIIPARMAEYGQQVERGHKNGSYKFNKF